MELRGKRFKGQTIDSSPEDHSGHRFLDCVFSGGALGMKTRRPEERLVIQNISAINCTVDTVTVGPVVFENLQIENLKTTQHLWLPGCAFKRCVLKGKIGEVLQFDRADPVAPRSDLFNRQFIEDNERIHSGTAWSLDISEAEFDDFDLRGVPGETVRINSTNQTRVDFVKALQAQESGAFIEIDGFPKMVMENGLKRRKESQYNFVLVTNPSSSDYRDMMGLFDWLAKNDLCFG